MNNGFKGNYCKELPTSGPGNGLCTNQEALRWSVKDPQSQDKKVENREVTGILLFTFCWPMHNTVI